VKKFNTVNAGINDQKLQNNNINYSKQDTENFNPERPLAD